MPSESVALSIGVFGSRGIPSTYSGYETFLTQMLPELAARGHDVTIYCRSGEDLPDLPAPFQGVRRVALPSLQAKQLDTLTHGVVAGAHARVFGHHDVVLVCNVANAPTCAFLRASGQRIVLNTDGQEWLRGKWGRLGRRFFLTSARLSRYAASALISDCNEMRRVYLSQFRADSTVIPYCAQQLTDARRMPRVYDFDYYVTGGRLVPENNVLEIATTYSRSHSPWPLIVLGKANYRSPVVEGLQRLASRDIRVRIEGHISDRARYFALLAQARAYFHGHSVGGMNPSLVEAMSSGALVCAYDTPFNREILGISPYYFSDCDSSLLTVIQELALLTPVASNDLRSQAIAATSQFSLASVTTAYEALLHRVGSASPYRGVTMNTPWTLGEVHGQVQNTNSDLPLW